MTRAAITVTRELALTAGTGRRCCQAAEAATILRIAAAPPGVTGAVLDGREAAARLRALTAGAFGVALQVRLLPGGEDARYLVAAAPGRDSHSLARQAELAGPGGEPLSGLPPRVVAGGICDCRAAWRGAFLAAGALSSPSRIRPSLTIDCPAREAALALAGAARRLGATAAARDNRGASRVVVYGPEEAPRLLALIGAPRAAADWAGRHEKWLACVPPESPARRAALGDANMSRAQQAAAAAALRAARALEILGDSTPDHLAAAGRLRAGHPTVSLSRLGQLACPPLSKHAIAGRLRHLTEMADDQAAALGVPGTSHPPASG